LGLSNYLGGIQMIDLTQITSILNESGIEGLTAQLTEADPENDVLISEAILQDELTEEELSEFLQSPEYDEAVALGMLSEKTIVRFDKTAKLSRAESQAILAIAREKGDRDFKKLITIWKVRKHLLDKLTKKYRGQAASRVRQNKQRILNGPKKVAKKVKK